MDFNKVALFIRDDSDSREALYDVEEPNVHVDVGTIFSGLKFVWDRFKSNENVNDHGFSHYLTRRYYNDKFRLVSGKKVGKDIVSIVTDDGNLGMLCSCDLNDFIKVDEDELEEAMLIVRQDELDSGRIRLISCYTTQNRDYIRWYALHRYFFSKRDSSRPDALDLKDVPAHVTEKREQTRLIQKEVFNETIEEIIDSIVESTIKFEEIVRNKTPLR
jgi:hypothetical protein